MRADGRQAGQLRPLNFEKNYVIYPEGSVLVSMGNTKVLCNASLEKRVAPWLQGRGHGWVTAEYNMLPRATHTRTTRDSQSSRPNSRALEISRLIGRSLRSVCDLSALGEQTITVDCDVLQADGGTRTASINGACMALLLASKKLLATKELSRPLLINTVAAVSVGIVDGELVLDLNYDEDSRAQVDLNIICDKNLDYIEIQGTAEKQPFIPEQLTQMLEISRTGLKQIIETISANEP